MCCCLRIRGATEWIHTTQVNVWSQNSPRACVMKEPHMRKHSNNRSPWLYFQRYRQDLDGKYQLQRVVHAGVLRQKGNNRSPPAFDTLGMKSHFGLRASMSITPLEAWALFVLLLASNIKSDAFLQGNRNFGMFYHQRLSPYSSNIVTKPTLTIYSKIIHFVKITGHNWCLYFSTIGNQINLCSVFTLSYFCGSARPRGWDLAHS